MTDFQKPNVKFKPMQITSGECQKDCAINSDLKERLNKINGLAKEALQAQNDIKWENIQTLSEIIYYSACN